MPRTPHDPQRRIMDVPIRDGPAVGRTIRVDRQPDGKPPPELQIGLSNGHPVTMCCDVGARSWHEWTTYEAQRGTQGWEYVRRRAEAG